jgi:hypothetical protein
MRSAKRARSVAHSLAHHAMSGLCFVHPHLGEQCRKHQKRQATIDLIQPFESAVPGVWPKPLELSLVALGKTFQELLGKEHIDPGYITSATALFDFRADQWPTACLARLALADGKSVDVAVGLDGREAEVVRHDT